MSSVAEQVDGVGTSDLPSALALSDENRDFADAARTQFSTLFGPAAVRSVLSGTSDFAAWWDGIVETGYLAIGVPKEHGGIGSLLDLVVVLEEAGRSLVPVPLLSTALSTQTRRVAGLPVDSERAHPGALGLASGGDLGRVLALDGTAPTVTVVHETAEGVAIAEYATSVRSIGPRRDIDASRPIRELALADAAPLEVVVLAGADIDAVLAVARSCVAADLTGVAGGAIDLAIAHVLTRRQFGRQLGAFQAVKHALADLYIQIEKARSLTRAAALELDADPLGPAGRRLAMMAKAVATVAALRGAALSVQLFGAMGLTFEADSHLFVRRAQQTAPILGGSSELFAQIARERGFGGAQ